MTDEHKSEDQKEAVESRGWQLTRFDWLKSPPIWFVSPFYDLATLFVLAVVILVGFGLFAAFQLAYETEIGEFKDRIEAAKVFFPIVLALVGGPLLIWRVVTAHVQAMAARKQAETDREGFYTDVFTKAIEQLGATREVKSYQEIDDGKGSREAVTTTEPNLEVRLGAIYALERIARDSERDHWPIMEVLCAYIRNTQNSGTPKIRPEDARGGNEEFSKWLYTVTPPRVDVQAAISVIGRRDTIRVEYEKSRGLVLDLSKASLQKAEFKGGNFSNAHFFDSHLEWTFFDKAHLEGALFMGAHCDIAVFEEAHLEHASLEDEVFDGAMFGGAYLDHAAFTGASLEGAMMRTSHMNGTWLFDTDLSRALVYDSSFEKAMGDATTKLPQNVARPTVWPARELTSDEKGKWVSEIRNKTKNVQT